MSNETDGKVEDTSVNHDVGDKTIHLVEHKETIDEDNSEMVETNVINQMIIEGDSKNDKVNDSNVNIEEANQEDSELPEKKVTVNDIVRNMFKLGIRPSRRIFDCRKKKKKKRRFEHAASLIEMIHAEERNRLRRESVISRRSRHQRRTHRRHRNRNNNILSIRSRERPSSQSRINREMEVRDALVLQNLETWERIMQNLDNTTTTMTEDEYVFKNFLDYTYPDNNGEINEFDAAPLGLQVSTPSEINEETNEGYLTLDRNRQEFERYFSGTHDYGINVINPGCLNDDPETDEEVPLPPRRRLPEIHNREGFHLNRRPLPPTLREDFSTRRLRELNDRRVVGRRYQDLYLGRAPPRRFSLNQDSIFTPYPVGNFNSIEEEQHDEEVVTMNEYTIKKSICAKRIIQYFVYNALDKFNYESNNIVCAKCLDAVHNQYLNHQGIVLCPKHFYESEKEKRICWGYWKHPNTDSLFLRPYGNMFPGSKPYIIDNARNEKECIISIFTDSIIEEHDINRFFEENELESFTIFLHNDILAFRTPDKDQMLLLTLVLERLKGTMHFPWLNNNKLDYTIHSINDVILRFEEGTTNLSYIERPHLNNVSFGY
uniref:RING-type domain-containing protein n=1 Tax=Parastrongyloides trichosuri TaxID=131310 RepID=A0A0N5A730_PARTI